MSNEMKLLMALCDALGFEVEVKKDYKERKITLREFRHHQNSHAMNLTTRVKTNNGFYDIDENDMCTLMLKDPIVSYTLTKKGN